MKSCKLTSFSLPSWLLVALLLAACGSDYPEALPGRSIQGAVGYDGQAHLSMDKPALAIYAFSSWPPAGPPHASRLYESPDFSSGGMAYELPNLDPYDYLILAQLQDLADEDGTAPVAGGYPDFCSFAYSPVTVANHVATDIDFELFDESGSADPCTDPAQQANPDPGKAALAVQVIAPGMNFQAESSDKLYLILFSAWPVTGPPLGFTQLTGAGVDFPVTMINNRVEPGSYALLVCLDLGGNNMMCDGIDDLQVLHDDGSLTSFAEGQILSLRMNLVSGESELIDP